MTFISPFPICVALFQALVEFAECLQTRQHLPCKLGVTVTVTMLQIKQSQGEF